MASLVCPFPVMTDGALLTKDARCPVAFFPPHAQGIPAWPDWIAFGTKKVQLGRLEFLRLHGEPGLG